MAYSVRRRIPEFGVRLALGARGGQVGRLVLSHGVLLAVVGIVLGSLTALALTRLLHGVLFGVSPTDPLTFGTVAVGAVVAAVLASLAPAWHAGRVDPATAMRAD
jgi:ABC-type antimicrobial peptide transport system permease subunit